MADKMSLGGNLQLPTAEAPVHVHISGEKKLQEALNTIAELGERVDRVTQRWSEATAEAREFERQLNELKEDTGLAEKEAELEKFQDTAARAVEEFKAFVKAMKLNPSDYSIQEYASEIEDGTKTLSEAIARVNQEFGHLIEFNWQQSKAFDVERIQDFTDTLQHLCDTIVEVRDKISSMERDGVKTISDVGTVSGESATEIETLVQKIQELSSNNLNGAGIKSVIDGVAPGINSIVDKLSDFGDKGSTAVEQISSKLQEMIGLLGQINQKSMSLQGVFQQGGGQFKTDAIELGLVKDEAKELIGILEELRRVITSEVKLGGLPQGTDLRPFMDASNRVKDTWEYLAKIDTSTTVSGVRKVTAEVEGLVNAFRGIYGSARKSGQTLTDIDWSGYSEAVKNLDEYRAKTQEIRDKIQDALIESSKSTSGDELSKPVVEATEREKEALVDVNSVATEHGPIMEQAALAEKQKAEASKVLVDSVKEETGVMGEATAETEHHVDVMAELEKEVVDLPTNLEKIRAALRREGVDSTYAEKIAEDFGSLEGKIDKVTVGAQVFGDNVRRVTGVAITEVNNLGDTIKKVLDYEYQLNDEGGYNLTATHMADTSTINYGKHEKLAVADAAKKEEEAFESAKRAVLAYSSAMKTYVSVKGDIVRSGDVFSAQNQSLQGTANILTQTTAVYRELTSAENLNNLSEEHKIEISRRVKKAEEDLTIALEKRENKEKSSSNKQAEIDSYNNAVNAITRYYKALTEVSQAGNNVMFDGNKWVSLSSDYDELANKLNSTKAAFEGVTDAMDKGKFSEEQYAKLTEKIQDGIVNQRLAEGRAAKQTAREVEQAAKEKYDAEKNCTTALTEGEAILRNYSAAENSRNESSRNAYRNLKESTEELRRAQSTYDGTTKGAEKLEAATRKYNLTLKESKRVIVANGDSVQSFGDKLKSAFKTLSMYFSMSRIIMSVYREIRKMISTSIELDQTMTQLRIVTKASNDEMQRFGETAAASAKRIGASITDLTSSATTFARLGYTMDESSLLAEYTTMLQNVGNIDVSDAQNAVTAIVKAFNDEIDINNIETVMDRLVVVGENIAQRRSNTSKEIGYIGQRRVGFIVQTEERLSA